MNDNIKVRRLVFDNKNPKQVLIPSDSTKIPTGAFRARIEILEIETENPSDLIMNFKREAHGNAEDPIYLFRFRDKMLLQNNKYIMRLDYLMDIGSAQWDIEIISESQKPFKLVAYYYFV